MHDTFYVVAHFHLMLSGAAMVAIFSGFYYYFTALFGIKYSRVFAYLHLLYYSGGH
ncbi:MAG: cbb3-type cytochrome c oxidase subunit I [Planctomycetes bacterium]|nr:cbb3-type cytochrome c oxidase subunit I [Planctomycetota bacterium]